MRQTESVRLCDRIGRCSQLAGVSPSRLVHVSKGTIGRGSSGSSHGVGGVYRVWRLGKWGAMLGAAIRL